MSSETQAGEQAAEVDVAALQARVEELEAQSSGGAADASAESRKLTIISTKATLDMAYPPMILGGAAAELGWDVVIYYTFWGLDVIHEEHSQDLQLSAVGNPNMPVPNAIGAIPGMDAMATWMMSKQMRENGVPPIEDLIEDALESGVDLQACQRAVDMMDYEAADFYDGVTTGVGPESALEHMAKSDVHLFV